MFDDRGNSCYKFFDDETLLPLHEINRACTHLGKWLISFRDDLIKLELDLRERYVRMKEVNYLRLNSANHNTIHSRVL